MKKKSKERVEKLKTVLDKKIKNFPMADRRLLLIYDVIPLQYTKQIQHA